MKEKLVSLLENSYSPYSKFRVSAIAVMNDGREFPGVNVENASYGASICAERSAILSAISNGYKKHDFKELYNIDNLIKEQLLIEDDSNIFIPSNLLFVSNVIIVWVLETNNKV